VHAAPAVSCAKCTSKKRTRAYRFSGGIRLSLRSGLRLIGALLGELCTFATVARAPWRELDTSLRVPEPYDFAIRFKRPRQKRHPRPQHPRPALLTLRNAPLNGTGWRISNAVSTSLSNLFSEKQKYFSGLGMPQFQEERRELICPSGSHTTAADEPQGCEFADM
jgi:hypothetical protein